MSDHKKGSENTDQKVVTKYDRKMQKRREQKEKEAREARRGKIIGILVAAVIVCVAAAFPIYTHMAMNKAVATVGGREVSQLEFDYYYNVAKNNYYNSYGAYMSMMGLDMTGDLSTQMYSDTLSWQDYFEQTAVTNITQTRALAEEAQANSFSYDASKDYKNFQESLQTMAETYGISIRSYVKQMYGSYATTGRIADIVKEGLLATAYYNHVQGQQAPADEEIQAYYEENANSYDSVDYYLTTVAAELPTEPTELADPVEEASDENAEDTAEGTETADDAADTEEPYEPSEAEIEKAMADAKKAADEIAEAADGKGFTGEDAELKENQTYYLVDTAIRDWLFDPARKADDLTVIEDASDNCYHVVSFVQRQLDQTPTADIRLILSQEKEGQAILDEWKSGAATEDSFVELSGKYSVDAKSANGSLYEGIYSGSLGVTELEEWALDAARTPGDTVALQPEGDSYYYVAYYVGQNAPEWKVSIKSILVSQLMSEYMTEITADMTVEDPEGNLNYLKATAQAEASQEEADGASEEADAAGDAAE